MLGGKEGIFHICSVLLNAGDIALFTDPGYPVYTSGPLLVDAEPYPLPINPDNNFLPDLDAIPADILERADAALYISKEAGRNRTTTDGRTEKTE